MLRVKYTYPDLNHQELSMRTSFNDAVIANYVPQTRGPLRQTLPMGQSGGQLFNFGTYALQSHNPCNHTTFSPDAVTSGYSTNIAEARVEQEELVCTF